MEVPDYCSVLECSEQVPCAIHGEGEEDETEAKGVELPDWPASAHTATFRGKRIPVVSKQSRQYTYDPEIPAVLTVESGQTVVFETCDEAYYLESQGIDVPTHRFNAVSGPVEVAGAQPGDAIQVDVLDIIITRTWMAAIEGYGPLARHVKSDQYVSLKLDDVVEEAHGAEGEFRIPTKYNSVWLSKRLKLKMRPMIGCIGTAPALGFYNTLAPIFEPGGNMDLRELEVGSSIQLPVRAEGGLVSLGDVHSCMGQGEVCAVALEAAAVVAVRLTLLKKAQIASPLKFCRLQSPTTVSIIGNGSSFSTARQFSIMEAKRYLREAESFDEAEAKEFLQQHSTCFLGGPADRVILTTFPDPSREGLAASSPVSSQDRHRISVKEGSLEKSVILAVRQTYNTLVKQYGLTFEEAYGYCCGEVDILIQEPTHTSTGCVAEFAKPRFT